ncbi:MAG: peptidoglycan-binding domain-containing protein [Paracoccaceae bacterium]
MLFEKPERAVDRVFVHCSATDRPEHDSVEVMRRWHVDDNGWSDVGYHVFIRKDGVAEAGRPLERTPAAQAGNNTGTIAICLHGLEESKFTEAQFETLIDLCRQILAAYEGGVTFHGHREVAAKECPVFDYKAVLGLDANGEMVFKPSADPATSDEAEAGSGAPEPLLRITARGPAVRRLQKRLKDAGHDVVVDGIFGQGTHVALKAFQKAAGLTSDGIAGPRTWAALG